jgi:hypothetical protein
VAQHTFSDFPFDARLAKNVEKKGFEHPTPIQDQAIPFGLLGRDIFGLANTGTGKTAAFLLPLIQKVLNNRKEQVLILAPTRELALQIEKEFVDFTYGTSLFSVSAVGGMPIFRQVTKIRRGVSFVVDALCSGIMCARIGKCSKHVLLLLHRALHARDEIRDKVEATLVLRLYLCPLCIDTLISTYEAVVDRRPIQADNDYRCHNHEKCLVHIRR